MRFTTVSVIVVMSMGIMIQAQAPAPIPAPPPTQHQIPNTATRAYGDGEFRLGPDDVIEISVYQEKDLSTTVPVRPDGKISVPLIGEMPASGKTATELQKEIAHRYTQYIAEPAVTVVVKEINSPKVSVLGEVKNPGIYKIKDRATVLDAIAMAGGLTEYAKRDKATVIRSETPGGQQRHIKVNLDDQFKGKQAGPFYVLPYDTVYIP